MLWLHILFISLPSQKLTDTKMESNTIFDYMRKCSTFKTIYIVTQARYALLVEHTDYIHFALLL